MVLQTGGDKAMILAAGLGTRLGQLTAHKPKALVEWEGKPLIDHVLKKLKESGFHRYYHQCASSCRDDYGSCGKNGLFRNDRLNFRTKRRSCWIRVAELPMHPGFLMTSPSWFIMWTSCATLIWLL